MWLDRARSFAMQVIDQSERMRAQWRGRGRYSLWTGDPGHAVYLWHCLEGMAELPAMDSIG